MLCSTSVVGFDKVMESDLSTKGSSNNQGELDRMSQSLARVLTHLIFSTKNRVRVLSPRIRSELHPYLAVVLREHRCPALQVGGIEDHVHLLFGLSRVTSLAEVVETVKTSSSKWIKGKGPDFRGFYWQAGYGAFSVSQSEADAVIDYIRCQEEHHKQMSFQEEYRRFLERYQIPYDERYVWD
jgi:REP element-mobilizing transposase RayT